jgi:3-oxoacyl-[acyl-carrier protein] reductase
MVEGTEGSHHKEGSKKMSKDSTVCAGIDTGKYKLDVGIDASADRLQVDNSPEGYRSLATWLQQRGVERIGIEASGGYEQAVVSFLRADDFVVIVFQPVQVRAYAKFVLQHAKNDNIDAALIASCAAAATDIHEPPDTRLAPLAQRLTMIEQLTQDVAQLKTRREACRDQRIREFWKQEIARAGGQADYVTGDITKFSDIEAMRRRIEREFGPVDILVANAGGSFTTPGPIEQTSEEEWRASVDGNLTATFLTIKSFLPRMKERRTGSIITMSSAAARRPHPMAPIPYAAAKAGIEILTQDLAGQIGPYGIRVNCIAPETILTERNKARIPSGQQDDLIELHPIKRLGTPEDVAHAALYLASDDAAWIAGIILDVAGGAVMV